MPEIANELLWLISPISIIAVAAMVFINFYKKARVLTCDFGILIIKILSYLAFTLIINLCVVFIASYLINVGDSEGAGFMILVILLTDLAVTIVVFPILSFATILVMKNK